jgi:lactobin A/cerein 7B family class IIb bacteriocin
MKLLEASEVEAVDGGAVPLVVYFVWGVYLGASGTSLGLYWASQ